MSAPISSPSPAPLKILISGAGIGGSALAFWLSHLGHSVTILERHPVLRTSGLQLDLRGPGIAVLDRMGLADAFRAKSAPEQGFRVVDKTGRQRASFLVNKTGKGLQGFTTEWEIMRGDFCTMLCEAAMGKGGKYVFNSSVESFKDKRGKDRTGSDGGGGVEVRLADGKTETYDLLVGADGIGSNTRKMMLGEPLSGDDTGFRPLNGQYIGYVTIPKPLKSDANSDPSSQYMATMYMIPGGRGIMMRRHSPAQVQAYLFCRSDSERLRNASLTRDVRTQKEALRDIFKGAGWESDEIVAALMQENDFYLERMGMVKLPSGGWSSKGGSVVLLGDAAHCPSANTGMGTTSALVGAYVLAGEIGKHCPAHPGEGTKGGLEMALKEYERKYRPFVEEVQKGIEEDKGMRKYLMPQSAFGIEVMNRLMGLASFLNLNVLGRFVLREDIKWELPEYKGLMGVKESK
ncbi:uncharacterized protein MKZ38_010132 [Zalerion maritima]|uniref:FAD-binding domain-containing protein n=1 Tax=Zalerion maritima TaxID=339359 RepID=A0AAD5WND1_9PEZI|nr:uncharacterized protein MKZ38_010132 [Zalerion maritima]